jgi:hypothetical protein
MISCIGVKEPREVLRGAREPRLSCVRYREEPVVTTMAVQGVFTRLR